MGDLKIELAWTWDGLMADSGRQGGGSRHGAHNSMLVHRQDMASPEYQMFLWLRPHAPMEQRGI